MESWLKRRSNSFENTEGQVAKKAKPEPAKFRLYLEDDVLIWFTSTSCNPPKALCFFCGETNSSMKPAHLQHHLKTKHGCHVGQPPDLFKRKLSEFRSSQTWCGYCRVDRIGTYIVEQVVGKLGDYFSLQVDESTDVSGNAKLVAFVRYVDTDGIYEQILFCKSLWGKTTGEDILMLSVPLSVKMVWAGNPAAASVQTQQHQWRAAQKDNSKIDKSAH